MSDTPLQGQTHFVAPVEESPLVATGTVDTSAPPTSQWKEAWKSLRGNWIFWVSASLLFMIILIVVVPNLFTGVDPRSADLSRSLEGPTSGHPFGFDKQGYDVYSRVIHGARASVIVGLLTTIIVMVIGMMTGALAGYFGGWADALVSRIADIFFAIPLLLAAIVGLSALNNVWPDRGYWGGVMAVVIALAAFGWPQFTRIARGAVLEIKHLEFIDSSKAIGASKWRTLFSHIIPNSLAPVIVTATVSLGVYIVAEATLSFLGIGLPSSIVSWGNDIAAAQSQVRSGSNLHVLLFPAGGLAVTVLSFMLLGDAVRDALDPKARK
ncbi:MAG: ABC transporter permease [Brevibacterium sp.]